jgi:hypothetical protein
LGFVAFTSKAQNLFPEIDKIPDHELVDTDSVKTVSVHIARTTNVFSYAVPDEIGPLQQKFFLDPNGRTSQIELYNSIGKPTQEKYIFHYHGDTTLVELWNRAELRYTWLFRNTLIAEAKRIKPDGEIQKKWVREYFEDGTVRKSLYFDSDSTANYSEYHEYDDEKNLIDYKLFKGERIRIWKKYSYNRDRFLVKTEAINPDYRYPELSYKLIPDPEFGVPHSVQKSRRFADQNYEWKYSFDSEGNCVESRVYREDGKLVRRFENRFDEKNRLIVRKEFKGKKVIRQYDTVFNSSGTVQRTSIFIREMSSLKTLQEINYHYNERGNYTFKEVKRYQKSGERWDYKYTYY